MKILWLNAGLLLPLDKPYAERHLTAEQRLRLLLHQRPPFVLDLVHRHRVIETEFQHVVTDRDHFA